MSSILSTLTRPELLSSITTLTTLLTVIALIATALFMFSLIVRQQRDIRAQERYAHARLAQLRRDIEESLYKLNDQLLASEGRWNDVNHLLGSISRGSQEYDGVQIGQKSFEIKNHRFLRSLGITEGEIEFDAELVFLLMPFHENYRQHYLSIRDACNDIGLKCFRGDERPVENIAREFVRSIIKARIVVALVDGRNPNVFFELGVAYSFDKNVIIVSQAPADMPADIRLKRFVFYNNFDELYAKLKDEIGKTLASPKN